MGDIGKITLSVSQTRTGQTIKIRTTGRRGSVLLNTISENVNYPSQSPSSDAVAFWTDVLAKASSAL